MSETNWIPGLIVLGCGLVLAVLFLLSTRRKDKPAAPEPSSGALEDLERRYQGLIEQLKELHADRHNVPAERFEAEKSRLELEAAAALRAREEHAQGQVKQPPAGKQAAPASPQGFFARRPELKGALWGGGVVLFFVALGLLLTQNERPREEGDSITGRMPPNAQPQPQAPQEDEALRTAIAEVNAHPENVEAAASVAHELLRRQEFDQANSFTERALGVDPFHVEHRIHQALLLAVRGDPQGSMQKLQHLADTFPDSQEALLFLGAIAAQTGNRRTALEHFERFLAEAPPEDHPPELAQGVLLLRRELGAR